MGPVGIEPTSSGLRDRCITVSATVPNQSARWELNPRPASYKDAALTVELRASESRVGGNRTHTLRRPTLRVGARSPLCCQLHHNPKRWLGVCVCSGLATLCLPFVLAVVSGSPENRTQHNAVISRVWTTSPRLPFESGTSESNRDPPAPKAGVLPSAPLPDCQQPVWESNPTCSA